MSVELDVLAPVVVEPTSANQIQRTAFYLESQGQPLFAWLHHRPNNRRGRQGVVICAPVGYEQVHAHRTLRRLADQLAEAGLPTLRFDYHGTGDSAGEYETENRVATWLANIHDALDWMQDQLGCETIHLVGLRIGATLAVQVATERPIESLLLWAPVVKGRAYVREIVALNAMRGEEASPAQAQEDLEAAGFVMSKQTASELSQLDLLKLVPNARRALILGRDDLQEDRRLLEYLQGCGLTVEQGTIAGYADMMAEPHLTKVPVTVIQQSAEWLSAPAPLFDEPANPDVRLSHSLVRQYQDVPVLAESHVRERTYTISQTPSLFGILTYTERSAAEELPFVVLLNAGSVHHIGPNRLYVHLARQLATEGFRCLRMDLCGLGDSVAASSEMENAHYADSSFADIALTLQKLQADFGARRIILLGLCSGAYYAFHSALQLTTPTLVESILINPATFYWHDGMSLDTAPAKQHKQFQYYKQVISQPDKWLKFFTGKSKTSVRGVWELAQQRWQMHKERHAPVAGTHTKPTAQREDLSADLERVANANRHLSFFFSSSDPGYEILKFHARRKVQQLTQAGKIDLFFVENADHTFSTLKQRADVLQQIGGHLRRRYQSQSGR